MAPGLLSNPPMSTQRWISLLTASLCLALVALAWVARPNFCLDSRFVEKIDMVSSDGNPSIGACRVEKHSTFSLKIWELKTGLERRLKALERALDYMQVKPEHLRITILNTPEPVVRIYPSQVLISAKALDSDQVLEKSLLLAILQGKKDLSGANVSASEILWAEVFSDLFLSFHSGGFSMQDPTLNESISLESQKSDWPFVLKTKQSYCKQPWRSLMHQSDCQTDKISHEQLFVSLRPFWDASFAKSLETLSVNDRIQWFRSVWANWKTLQIEPIVVGSSVGPEDQQLLADAARGIENWMKNFRTWAKNETGWKELTPNLEIEIQKRGFRDQNSPLQTDLLVMASDESGQSALNGLHDVAIENPKRKILFVQNQEARLLPELEVFPKSWLGSVHSRQAILIQCSSIKIESLKLLAESVQKLMLIQSCDPKLNLSWGSLFRGGFDEFISQNPNVNFIQFHLPSLKSALVKNDLNPIPLLIEGNWQNPFFQQIGWEKPRWDQGMRAFKSRAAIEAIESYRLGPAPEASTL